MPTRERKAERRARGGKQLKLVRALLRPVPRLASRSSRTGRPFFPSLTVVILTRPKVLVGLDGAGKSTLLQTILGDAPEKTLPTFGFNNESTHRAGFDIDLYDLGGGKRIRGIWKAYMADVHGCIFVVDSADEDRIAECREVFAETLRDPHLSGKPIVVFANKQDLPEAKSAAEVAEGLGLSTMQNARHHIVACTALRATRHDDADTNVDLGMRWMLEKVGEDWDELNPRVAAESEAAREKEEALKRERVKRGSRRGAKDSRQKPPPPRRRPMRRKMRRRMRRRRLPGRPRRGRLTSRQRLSGDRLHPRRSPRSSRWAQGQTRVVRSARRWTPRRRAGCGRPRPRNRECNEEGRGRRIRGRAREGLNF